MAPPAIPAGFRDAILTWYDATGRSLPFRASRDPYAILVSEVMAQQTQIGRVAAAWQAWLERFPTVDSLASATPAEVLRAWSGLGYNRRAIQLHRAARAIVADHGGRVPDRVGVLERLPGIGPYTARAVAAIAFGQSVGAIDTNVRRVLGRTLAADGVEMSPRALQDLADAAVSPDRPAAWTHALMDVGAAFCRPRSPRCEGCPARPWCRYARAAARRAEPIPAPPRTRPRRPFPTTSRWLRGRIVERLAAATDWMPMRDQIGDHPAEAVATALRALRRDGIVELDPDDPTLARLALA